MEELLLHPISRQRLAAYLKRPSHAVQLIAPAGFGKGSIARVLAAELLGISTEKLKQYAYFKHYEPIKGSIGIEQARDITIYTRLNTTGTRTLRRAIIIESFETMTLEAQNAILKLLEEPPEDTVIIMTVAQPSRVLPTIISRSQRVTLHNPDRESLTQHFSANRHSQTAIDSSYLMSGGLIGLMHALLQSDTEHELVRAINQAKDVLRSDTFQRLAMIDTIAKDKQVDQLIFALKQTSQAALAHAAGQPGRDAAIKRWHSILKQVHRAEGLHANNTQSKLLLTDLFLSM